nr:PREDICTED: centrosomal protein of 290 kDa-like [Notothenia coriiceps]
MQRGGQTRIRSGGEHEAVDANAAARSQPEPDGKGPSAESLHKKIRRLESELDKRVEGKNAKDDHEKTKGEVVRWEEGKRWQAKMEKLKNSLRDKERENEALLKQLGTLRDLYSRSVRVQELNEELQSAKDSARAARGRENSLREEVDGLTQDLQRSVKAQRRMQAEREEQEQEVQELKQKAKRFSSALQLGQEDSRRSVGPTGSSYFLTPSVPYLPRLALCWARGETPARLSLRRTESQSR